MSYWLLGKIRAMCFVKIVLHVSCVTCSPAFTIFIGKELYIAIWNLKISSSKATLPLRHSSWLILVWASTSIPMSEWVNEWALVITPPLRCCRVIMTIDVISGLLESFAICFSLDHLHSMVVIWPSSLLIGFLGKTPDDIHNATLTKEAEYPERRFRFAIQFFTHLSYDQTCFSFWIRLHETDADQEPQPPVAHPLGCFPLNSPSA